MIRVFVALLLLVSASTASATDKLYHSMLDSDVIAKKQGIVAKVLNLSEEDALIFNPIFKKYQEELVRLNDKRSILAQEYAAINDALSADVAEVMTDQFLELEEKELEIKRKYLAKIAEELTPVLAAHFYHMDTKLNLLIHLQTSIKLPLRTVTAR